LLAACLFYCINQSSEVLYVSQYVLEYLYSFTRTYKFYKLQYYTRKVQYSSRTVMIYGVLQGSSYRNNNTLVVRIISKSTSTRVFEILTLYLYNTCTLVCPFSPPTQKEARLSSSINQSSSRIDVALFPSYSNYLVVFDVKGFSRRRHCLIFALCYCWRRIEDTIVSLLNLSKQ
jgi:hypothetical protein